MCNMCRTPAPVRRGTLLSRQRLPGSFVVSPLPLTIGKSVEQICTGSSVVCFFPLPRGPQRHPSTRTFLEFRILVLLVKLSRQDPGQRAGGNKTHLRGRQQALSHGSSPESELLHW